MHFQRNGKTKAIIYQHCDGYPDGLGNDLRTFIHTLPKDVRVADAESLGARFATWQSVRSDIAIVLEDPECIEYRYLVDCDGKDGPAVKVEAL